MSLKPLTRMNKIVEITKYMQSVLDKNYGKGICKWYTDKIINHIEKLKEEVS